ncbi:MAG: bile acid:sodium symporter family protein [Saprospiraceae bacterium]|nr:bile acid:sodium symporter family protein [Saprospiraceae bacterium]
MHIADQVSVHFNSNQITFLNICLGFLMFGVALDLKLSHFRKSGFEIRSIVTGLISQWIILPALTLVLIFIIQPYYSIALGMLLVACCPGGNVSNYAVHLSGSNTYLSLILTTISTLLCVFTTPLLFGGLSYLIPDNQMTENTFEISILQMCGTILQLIILPMLAGMILVHYANNFVLAIKGTVKKVSLFIFTAFVFGGIYSNLDNIGEYLHLVFWIVMLHNGLALFAGYSFAKINKLDEKDSRAISIETGIQNSGLALVLIFNFFDGLGGMALIAAWWSVWHLISAIIVALYWKSDVSIFRVS